MQRPLATLACFFLLGLLLGKGAIYFPLSILLVIGLALTAEAILRGRGYSLPAGPALFAVLISGLLYAYFINWHRPADDVSRFASDRIGWDRVTLRGYIDSPVVHYPDRSVVLLTVEEVSFGGQKHAVSGRVRLRASDPFLGSFQYGDILEARVRLRSARGLANPGLFDFAAYLKRQGILAEASVSRPADVTKTGRRGSILLRTVYQWREHIRHAALHSLSAEPLAVFLAMIIGETGHLDNRIRDIFMASGTTHILSISGSHLGLVAFVVFPLARKAILLLPPGILLRISAYATPSQWAAGITAFPVVFYALLAGGQVATIRSLIMILAFLLAVLLFREDNLLNALGLAALLVLLWNPNALGDISFQLSYGSVLIMALVIDATRRKREGDIQSLLPRHLKERLLENGRAFMLITLAATLGTAPIVAYYFNQVSWVGLLSNLLLVPVAGMIIVPLGLFSAIGSLLMQPARLPLGGLVQNCYEIFYAGVELFSRLPWSEIRVASPSPLLLCAIYLLAFGIYWSRTRRRIRWGLTAAILFLPFLGALIHANPVSSHTFRVSFLDVGQGDAAVIQFPKGQVMVVDAGRTYGDYDLGRLVVAPFLWDRGIHRIHYLVGTHPQLDHMGGLAFLLDRFEVGEVWTNGIEVDADFYRKFRTGLNQKDLAERRLSRQPAPVSIGGCEVDILHPEPPSGNGTQAAGLTSSKINNLSLVLRIECPPFSVLLTGDIEKEAEREMAALGERLRSTLVKVPHHGSRGSIQNEFIHAVSPKIALISAGAGNPYGHPADEVIAAYESLGGRLFRTDRDGAILVQADHRSLRVTQASDLPVFPVAWDRNILLNEWKNLRKRIAPPHALILTRSGSFQYLRTQSPTPGAAP